MGERGLRARLSSAETTVRMAGATRSCGATGLGGRQGNGADHWAGGCDWLNWRPSLAAYQAVCICPGPIASGLALQDVAWCSVNETSRVRLHARDTLERHGCEHTVGQRLLFAGGCAGVEVVRWLCNRQGRCRRQAGKRRCLTGAGAQQSGQKHNHSETCDHGPYPPSFASCLRQLRLSSVSPGGSSLPAQEQWHRQLPSSHESGVVQDPIERTFSCQRHALAINPYGMRQSQGIRSTWLKKSKRIRG